MTADWLIGPDRSQSARDRLLDITATLIAEHGIDRIDINELAARAHCSRATIYRYTGGKKQLIEAVFVHTSTRITDTVHREVVGLTGPRRARTAIAAAIREMRADPVARRFLHSQHINNSMQSAMTSPALAAIAADLIGLDPHNAARAALALRCFLSLLLWPPLGPVDESHIIEDFATAFSASPNAAGPLFEFDDTIKDDEGV